MDFSHPSPHPFPLSTPVSNDSKRCIQTAIAWCLAWGSDRSPQYPSRVLEKFHKDLRKGNPVAPDLQQHLTQVQRLQAIAPDAEFPSTLEELQAQHPQLWAELTPIGLVYGGATKIKQYVFEGNNLQDIRGASALLDHINLVDLPGFFTTGHKAHTWLQQKFPVLATALIPELIIYATGGNILAFCPAAFIDDLANAIEHRYTEETLSANSCAVGDRFRLLELHYGRLPQSHQKPFWLNDYLTQGNDPILQAYFAQTNLIDAENFIDRKSFSELVTHLASQFNQRRGGMTSSDRPSRRFPPMLETHPYLQRDDNDRRSAIARIEKLPSRPKVSLTSARKRIVGQLSKREDTTAQWFTPLDLDWQPNPSEFKSWVSRFVDFLEHPDNQSLKANYYQTQSLPSISEARSLPEIGDTSTPKGFIAHIYADGNNMGGYIQKQIKSPEAYQEFSREIFDAMQQAVYQALAQHLQIRRITRSPENSADTTQAWIHPFEILAIGGDDVSLIVPAEQALAIAQTIGEAFEKILVQHPKYQIQQSYNPNQIHRYKTPNPQNASPYQSVLSLSIGVLLCADNTPIYYAQSLVEQLLKSAKKRAKDLKQKGYCGGTIDFLVMKSVTMISSNLKEFRAQALTKASLKLKLYAAPYTLHEVGGLLKTVKALKQSEFPTSQLYQLRSLLEQGKRTAMLNYRYFRARLNGKGDSLQQHFEDAWCRAKQNDGNLAPWISILESENTQDTTGVTYETIWRDLVDLLPFTSGAKPNSPSPAATYTRNPITTDRSPRR
jgi:CRISPR-associated protein Cmr2